MKSTCVSILLLLFSCILRAQNDCPDAIIICGDANYFDLEAEGPGVDDFLELEENPCASGENNTIWLKIQINEGGTLGFDLTPENPDLTTDFDFWLFGPFDDCITELPAPIRCSTTNPLQAGVGIVTGMNEIETDTSEGPGPDGNGYVNWIEVEDNQFFFLVVDRPHGSGNFSMNWTGTATFYPVPVFNNPDNIPLDIIQCDTDFVDDATSTFDLTIYEEMFYGDQEQEDIIITYHENLNDSTLGIDPIENPAEYINTSQVQTIYLRMTNIFTNCYSNHTFNIEVLPTPQQGEPADLNTCDEGNDGVEQFNLALNDDEIRNGNLQTVVTYHTSLEDAMAGANEVGPLFSNQVPFEPQTIWARLMDVNGCFSHDFFSFEIAPFWLPQFNNPDNIPLDLFECDNDGVNDQTTVFDLTQHEDMLVDDQIGIIVTYHTSFEDAEGSENFITTPQAYTNTSNPQVIYVRFEDFTTACYNIMEFTLNVTGIEAGDPSDLVLCDTNENGIREFDLSVNDEILINGEEGAEVTYHVSEEDANNDENPIGPLYENTVPYEEQTIWARVEKNTGECLGLAFESFTIRVEPLPYFNNPTNMSLDLTECDNDGTDDGITTFDL
ncbi:MAG TPA: hypothetical protein VEA37_02530, partial [Flavobacterium sp.]|nr:hypothetical protein [Flavobacterium sp.]